MTPDWGFALLIVSLVVAQRGGLCGHSLSAFPTNATPDSSWARLHSQPGFNTTPFPISYTPRVRTLQPERLGGLLLWKHSRGNAVVRSDEQGLVPVWFCAFLPSAAISFILVVKANDSTINSNDYTLLILQSTGSVFPNAWVSSFCCICEEEARFAALR